MPDDLSRAMNDTVLRRLAGDRTYNRGHDYYTHGHVESLEAESGNLQAVVRGTDDYSVTLTSDEGVLDYACDCPQGVDGSFCKHCVAAALAWLNRDASKAKKKSRRKPKKITLTDAAKILQEEDTATVVRMVMAWAEDDGWLRERLLQYAARKLGPETAVAAAERAFRKAARIRGFLDYRRASAWARDVDEAIDNIGRVLEDGQAAASIELCESALQELVDAYGSIDDSDGHLSYLRDRLEDIHFRACQEARPDPVDLARRLLGWELHDDLDIFFGAAQRYEEILGPEGLQEYRRLAEPEWEKVPARSANEKASEWGRYFRITSIMESLARACGDIEELVGVLRRDLSHAYSYLRIAEAYRDAGLHDQALLWAEKGLQAFPEHTDGRLREFTAHEYHRLGRHEDAMKLIWAGFEEGPYLGAYQKLAHHAKRAEAWPRWRERALDLIRGRIATAKEESHARPRSRWMDSQDDHSRLVEIFLFEGDTDAAWREAQEGGCSQSLWLELAAAREKDHPADAAPIYLKEAEEAMAEVRNSRYGEPVDLLVKAAAVMKRMDRSEEFVKHLEALRVKHKRKSNFIKRIEQKRKLLYL